MKKKFFRAALVFVVALFPPFLSFYPAHPARAGVSRSADGWTTVTPSADTRIIYVSWSGGDDGNDGLSPSSPKKTPEAGIAAMRNGYPDHLLFRRGDVWPMPLGQWTLSGRSPQEPMLIGAYGSGERPLFEVPEGESGLYTNGAGSPPSMDNLVFMDLAFKGIGHDPSRGAPSGAGVTCLGWLEGGRDIIFEGMKFQFCSNGFQVFDGYPIERITIRRSLILDSYSLDESHAQGIYLEGVSSFTLEENVFDNCGWHPDVPGALPTKFNHCIYWQYDSAPDGVVRGNLILRGASHGMQMRSSGTVEGNVLAGNAIAAFHGNRWSRNPEGEYAGKFNGNLITEGQDILPRGIHAGNEERGWAWEVEPGIPRIQARDNIITHCASSSSGRGTCQSVPNELFGSENGDDIHNNIVWDWPNNNGPLYQDQSSGQYSDPGRTLSTYNASLGGAATFAAFAAEARKQSRENWRPQYAAPAVIAYFRAGFSASSPTAPPSSAPPASGNPSGGQGGSAAGPSSAPQYSPSGASAASPTINDDKGITGSSGSCGSGSLIKGSLAAVYYCGADGKRYVFANEKVYFSWYADFSAVTGISDALLASIPIGGNVTYRPGSKLVKIQTDPKTYAVDKNGTLRWVSTEDAARRLYGPNWNRQVEDIPDPFFIDYRLGEKIV